MEYYDDELMQAARNVAAETTMNTLQTIAGNAARVEQVKRDALRQVGDEIPGFVEFYGSKDFQETLAKRPLLRNAIGAGEMNGVDGLSDLYRSAWDARVSLGVSTSTQPQPRNSHGSTGSTDLSTSTARQKVIRDFEAGGGDVPIDIGDPTLGQSGGR
jgi:hypothetical protein